MVEEDTEDIETIKSGLEGIKKINKTPDMERLQKIPVGKCESIQTDLGNGKVEEVIACRKNEDTWDIAGPEIKAKVKTFDMKDMEPSDDEITEDQDEF
jgi:hypothetical protein